MRSGRMGKIIGGAGALWLAFVGAALAEGPVDWQMGLQTAASPIKEEMESFHNFLLIICTAIVVLVLALLVYVMVRFSAKRNPVPSKTTHNTLIEVVWTIVPVLVLLAIVVPSFRLLYFGDRTENPEMTLMISGHQWNWSYEYPDQQISEFTSVIVPDDQLQPDQPRLLTVDTPVVLPVDTDIQLLMTATDVIHSWAVPAFGVKKDAVPGRTNETWVRIDRPGVYYGQCSEICGDGHGFMPIEVHAVSRADFDAWVLQQVGTNPETPPKLLTMNWYEAQAKMQLAAATP